ncbi:hypothetical protein FQN57_003510 [Myotisia sp. PD_48]|nr:hypothetical protein FQN57_003510 [Myotisia sp. PD_48]
MPPRKRRMTKRSPPTPITNNSQSNPISSLNQDVLLMIFFYFEPKDIIVCERVSRLWADWVAGYVETVAFRQHFPNQWSVLKHKNLPLTCTVYKDAAYEDEAFANGRASSVRHFKGFNQFQSKGNFMAWTFKDSLHSGPVIQWQEIPPMKEGKASTVSTITSQNLWSDPDIFPTIEQFTMDEAGLLLVKLKAAGSLRQPYKMEVLYSLKNGSATLFRDRILPGEDRDQPFILGKNRVYYHRTYEGYVRTLVAYDYGTQKQLYETQLSQIPSYSKVLFLFPATTISDELVLLYDKLPNDDTIIRLVNGSNGQIVHTTTINCVDISIVPDPFDNSSIQLCLTYRWPKHLANYRFRPGYQVVRKLTVDKGSVSWSKKADIVFSAPNDMLQIPNFRPLTLQAVRMRCYRSRTWVIQLSSILATRESGNCSLAEKLNDNTPLDVEIDRSLTVARIEKEVTLPPRRGFSKRRLFPKINTRYTTSFLPDGRIMLRQGYETPDSWAQQAFLIDFSRPSFK